jgi:hypothetical protein
MLPHGWLANVAFGFLTLALLTKSGGAKLGANQIREAGSTPQLRSVGGAQLPALLSARDAGSA